MTDNERISKWYGVKQICANFQLKCMDLECPCASMTYRDFSIVAVWTPKLYQKIDA
ncbi:hypothetical protein LCGC14_2931820, partial [marine sediment metagenome]